MQTRKVLGVIYIAVGLFWVVGSVTGNLAPMLAAFFDPSLLTTNPQASNPNPVNGAPSNAGGNPGNSSLGSGLPGSPSLGGGIPGIPSLGGSVPPSVGTGPLALP